MLGPREILHTLVWVKRHLLRQMPVAEVALLAPHTQPSDVLLDLGSHAGAWTVALSGLVPQGKVFAFEALPYYARVLRATLRVLRKTNVEVVGNPVLDESKPVQIVWRAPGGNRLTGLTHLKGKGESTSDTLEVEGITLDEISSRFGGPVRFIKMDIEGAELLALKGAERLLDTFRPLLYLELNQHYCQRYGHTAGDVFRFLSRHNYRGYQHDADDSWRLLEANSYSGAGEVWFVPVEREPVFVEVPRR